MLNRFFHYRMQLSAVQDTKSAVDVGLVRTANEVRLKQSGLRSAFEGGCRMVADLKVGMLKGVEE